MEFVNSNGASWRPKVTARVLADFEKQTGVEIFATFMGMAQDQVDASEIGKKIFGRIGNVMTLLYLACRDSAGKVITEGAEVSYDQFCDAITGDQLQDAVKIVMAVLMESFGGKKEGEGKPADPSPGKTSSN